MSAAVHTSARPADEAHTSRPLTRIGLTHIGFARAAGIVAVALIPALFWTGMMVGVGAMFGTTFEMTTLIAISSSIALFLSAVCAPIMLRNT